MATNKRDPAVQRVLRDFQERKGGHEEFCHRCEERHKTFHGVLEVGDEAEQWETKLAPHYAEQLAETMIASLVDDVIRYRVRPRPLIEDVDDQGALTNADLANGARAHELLLGYQLDCDRFGEKAISWVQQDAILGISPLKLYWQAAKAERYRELRDQDEYGREERVAAMEEYDRHDDPTTEVVRSEDFLWEEAATSVQASPFLIHRIFTTHEELERLQQQGVYENVDQLDKGDRSGINDDFYRLDQDLHNERRAKNRVELLEYWYKHDGKVCATTVGDRKVLLADRPGIFDHGEYPFIVLSGAPDLFRIPGRSLMERIAGIQKALWTLMNQRITNIRLLNNFIIAVRDDLIDPDELEFYPGAKWSVPGDVNESIRQFMPDPNVGQISLLAEDRLMGVLQNITSGMPFMSGAQSSTVDQTTATGVSIITSLAQRVLSFKKQIINWALERIGDQLLGLNQQFITSDRLVPIIGQGGAMAWSKVFRDTLPGRYHVNVEPARESLMRQEKRAEATSRLQVAAQTAALVLGAGSPWNMRALQEDWLRAFEVDDLDRYFADPAQMGGQTQPMLPGMPGQAAPNGNGSPNGVTAPQASDMNSPSNAISQSPEAAMARLMSMAGGPNNL